MVARIAAETGIGHIAAWRAVHIMLEELELGPRNPSHVAGCWDGDGIDCICGLDRSDEW